MLKDNGRIAFEFLEFEAITVVDRRARKPLVVRAGLYLWTALVTGAAMYAASYHGVHLDMDALSSPDDAEKRELRILAQEPFDF